MRTHLRRDLAQKSGPKHKPIDFVSTFTPWVEKVVIFSVISIGIYLQMSWLIQFLCKSQRGSRAKPSRNASVPRNRFRSARASSGSARWWPRTMNHDRPTREVRFSRFLKFPSVSFDFLRFPSIVFENFNLLAPKWFLLEGMANAAEWAEDIHLWRMPGRTFPPDRILNILLWVSQIWCGSWRNPEISRKSKEIWFPKIEGISKEIEGSAEGKFERK